MKLSGCTAFTARVVRVNMDTHASQPAGQHQDSHSSDLVNAATQLMRSISSHQQHGGSAQNIELQIAAENQRHKDDMMARLACDPNAPEDLRNKAIAYMNEKYFGGNGDHQPQPRVDPSVAHRFI